MVAPALGDAGRATERRLLFGFAEHVLETRYVGSSTGIRRRFVQPTGRIDMNGKSSDFSRSAWVGRGTRDYADIDIAGLDGELTQRLGWAERSIELASGVRDDSAPHRGRGPDVLPARLGRARRRRRSDGLPRPAAAPGSASGSTTPVTLRSNWPSRGLECEPFVTATASFGGLTSVFDNGYLIRPTGVDPGGRSWVS